MEPRLVQLDSETPTRRCHTCGWPLPGNAQGCRMCAHDGPDPQEYAALFWDEV